MLSQIESLRRDTLVYELQGFITEEEIQYIDDGIVFMLQAFKKINLMIYINAKGESFRALVKEFQLGIKYSKNINRIAFISNESYWNLLISLNNMSSRFKERCFHIDEIAEAWDWINKD